MNPASTPANTQSETRVAVESADAEVDQEWQPGKPAQTVAMVVLILIGVGYLIEAWQLPAGTADDPGLGMYPRIAGVLCTGSLIVALVQHLMRRDAVSGKGRFAIGPMVILASVLGYFVLAPIVGHVVTATAVVAVVLRVTGRRPWWQVGLIAVMAGLGSYLLMTTVLGLPLPAGELGLEF